MNYGDMGRRFVAFLLDGIILFIAGLLFAYVLPYVAIIIAPIISWGYYILMEGGSWHATLGKRVMNIYVADENGNGISYATAFLRMIGKILSGLILGIGYIMGLFSEQKQCLHDMIAKTYVLSGKGDEVVLVDRNGGWQGGVNVNGNGYANRGRIEQNVPGNMNLIGYASEPELVGVSGPLAGMIYPIHENGLIIGRDSISCQVVVPSSQASVSRIHCYVTFNPMSGMFIINDRNSTHGTFRANGEKIPFEQPVALKSGDRFYLATPENMFEVR